MVFTEVILILSNLCVEYQTSRYFIEIERDISYKRLIFRVLQIFNRLLQKKLQKSVYYQNNYKINDMKNEKAIKYL